MKHPVMRYYGGKFRIAKCDHKHEMKDHEHVELLQSLLSVKRMVIISGYDCEMYNYLLSGWENKYKLSRITAGRGTVLRVDCVWLSPSCNHPQFTLFSMAVTA